MNDIIMSTFTISNQNNMKTLTEKQSFFTRLANGDRKTQIIVFVVAFTIIAACVLLFGHAYQGYYYSK